MKSLSVIQWVLMSIVILMLAALVYAIIKHPWWVLTIACAVQLAGMWWAWNLLTREDVRGFERIGMAIAWPLTLVASWVGRVQ